MEELIPGLAVELWGRWFDWDGNPWVMDDDDPFSKSCFFCGSPGPLHDKDVCVYPLAKKLVEAHKVGVVLGAEDIDSLIEKLTQLKERLNAANALS